MNNDLIAQLREALESGLALAALAPRYAAAEHKDNIYAALAALDKLEAQPDIDAAVKAVPVAWRVRGYSQFRTGKPTPWRYVDGEKRPLVNDPACCDMEPLFTIDAAMKEEKE